MLRHPSKPLLPFSTLPSPSPMSQPSNATPPLPKSRVRYTFTLF